jgi:hypothetical protein
VKNLSEFNDADLAQELERRAEARRKRVIIPDLPVGYWEVTTEGDCEGRSTRHLGIHRGHICEIALALAGAAEYSLKFEQVPEPTVPKGRASQRDTANVSVYNILNSGHNPPNDDELKRLRAFFGPAWEVEAGQYYESVKISRK